MSTRQPTTRSCPDCDAPPSAAPTPDRRAFLSSVVAAAAAGASLPLWATPRAAAQPTAATSSETAVKAFYETLTPKQQQAICFPWEHQVQGRGLLRTHVSNNWQITKPTIDSSFYTKEQKGILFDIFKGLFQPEWQAKIQKQLKDDSEGRPWGAAQSVALFGTPGAAKFEFVMTGRHMTIRADGNSENHVALGGPIFHGHAAGDFNEKPDHPGNVFWHQAVAANKVYQMFSGKQQQQALVASSPHEAAVKFRGAAGAVPGLPGSEMSADQLSELKRVLALLIEPYRQADRDEIMACLEKQGGLGKCALAFYKDGDVGEDGVWDNWRLEGPSFVWYFRGDPHVHIWINVADSPDVKLNARG